MIFEMNVCLPDDAGLLLAVPVNVRDFRIDLGA